MRSFLVSAMMMLLVFDDDDSFSFQPPFAWLFFDVFFKPHYNVLMKV
jgi:hypothetical protein